MLRRRFHSHGTSNFTSSKFHSMVPSYESNRIKSKSGRSSIVTKLIFLSITFFLSLSGYWINLSNKDPGVIRISASDYANLTQFVPCISDVSKPPYFSEIKHLLRSHRKLTREPSYDSLPCSPPDKNMCFRAVYDGFSDFLPLARNNVAPKDQMMERKHKDEVVHRIALLVESLILHPEIPITPEFQWDRNVTLIQTSGRRYKSYDNEHVENDYKELHADYFEVNTYVFTAVLYDDPSEDLLGGQTAIVNIKKKMDRTLLNWFSNSEKIDFGMKQREKVVTSTSDIPSKAGSNPDSITNNLLVEFTSGLLIEPKPGRLVIFSGGGENIHTPVEVKRGTRPTFHFWFKCSS